LRRKDADGFRSTIEAERLRGIVFDPRRAKVSTEEHAKHWLAGRSNLAVRTAELYGWLIARYIVPAFGATSLADVSPLAVRAWHAQIATDHPTTAAKAYRLLSTIMRSAVTDEVLSRNPCQVKGASREAAPERPVASIAEVRALADAMPERLRIAVLLAAWCQLRRGELLGLRRKDVDQLHGTITVAVTRTKTMAGRMVDKAPKTHAGRRTVAVPGNVLPPLVEHLQRFVGAEPDALVLDGGYRPLRTAWDNARHAVAVPYRLHDLRHAGLTWSAATVATVAELMHRAGHASPTAALRYQHATEDRDRALADALADLAQPAPVVVLGWRDARGIEPDVEHKASS